LVDGLNDVLQLTHLGFDGKEECPGREKTTG